MTPFAFSPNALGQPAGPHNSVLSESSAVQFHLIGGYAVSYLSPLSTNSSFRITADFNLNSSSLEGPSKSNSPSYTQDIDRSSDYSSYGVDVVVSYVYSTAMTVNSSFYFGFGPAVRYSKSSNDGTYVEHPSASSSGFRNEYGDRAVDWGVGARAIVGLQAQLTTTVSLLAEYQISAFHLWRENRSKSSYSSPYSSGSNWSSIDQKGWEFTLNSIRLGIAVFL